MRQDTVNQAGRTSCFLLNEAPAATFLVGLRLERLVVLPSLSRGRGLLRGLATVLGGPASAGVPAQLLPVIFTHIDAVMPGGFLDVGEGQFTVFVGNAR